MLFNSLQFAVFLPVVVAAYYLLPLRFRTVLLLLASCVFYMAFIPAYIVILFATISVDYFAGMWIERAPRSLKRLLLLGSIIVTCAILCVFKYFHFLESNVVWVAQMLGWQLALPEMNIVLPIGLSFHTFQSLSYVIEVYRGNQPAERNFWTYATYVMFFPQLVAGPIERPQNLLHQFYERHEFDYAQVTSGLKRMAWGFYKKLVVADRLALYVNDVYANPRQYNGLQLTLATVFFAYQIYCDFSGYSDIAIGTARILGFRLMENFDVPYYASSVSEFWRRWHISLSTWFRDYVYVPLGGSRGSFLRRSRNLLITFGISGLWHGANWTFVLWGLLNGLYVIVEVGLGRLGLMNFRPEECSTWRRISGTAVTAALTLVAWVIFRARTLQDAVYVYSHWYRDWDFRAIKTAQFQLKFLPAAVGSIIVLEVLQYLRRKGALEGFLVRLPTLVRWPVYAGSALGVLLFGVFREKQFIYFQF